ncbi:hypothetical protein [Macrococcus epidermidis]|uniref:hypothetical protein n=1 Tax=Macrococcus epidermidis TaxID=1902580 RepID=UPI0020B70FAF|nr:hypothetical protein [Macrococcus epidermidis]UTH15070.1 hypothetical protein KFV12_06945 [Macrococcus epidermidis]
MQITSSLPWAAHFNAQDIQMMKVEYAVQYQHYFGFTKAIANWYRFKYIAFRL